MDGFDGISKNVGLVRALREGAGLNIDIMLDCWSSWSVFYTIWMAERLEEYYPRWLEESVMPDKIEQCVEICRNSWVFIVIGETQSIITSQIATEYSLITVWVTLVTACFGPGKTT